MKLKTRGTPKQEVDCDMCHKGIIRITLKGIGIKCEYCQGTGKLNAPHEYKHNLRGQDENTQKKTNQAE